MSLDGSQTRRAGRRAACGVLRRPPAEKAVFAAAFCSVRKMRRQNDLFNQCHAARIHRRVDGKSRNDELAALYRRFPARVGSQVKAALTRVLGVNYSVDFQGQRWEVVVFHVLRADLS